MEFITTGNRIAVENFEIGYFYTITMLSGNNFQACCTGIGSDFVMFSRDEPDLLFSLTMQSAADVSSIELYGGGSGTNDYNDLINKPQINSITLIGNKSLSDLGIQETISDLDTIRSGAAAGATAVQPADLAIALATKQDTISDLNTIRSGAAAGATAVQPAAMSAALATKQNTISDLDTIRSGAAAGATAVQPAAMSAALATKQDTISDLDTIRSGAAAGATAVQPAAMSAALATKQDTLSSAQLAAVNSGIDSSKVAQIETNKNNILLLENYGGGINKLDCSLSKLKNLNSSWTWNDNVATNGSQTITVNSDKTLTVHTTNVHGQLNFNLTTLATNQGGLFVSGCPSGGSASTYKIAIANVGYDTGNGKAVPNQTTARSVFIEISANVAVDLVFKPMIIDQSIHDNGFQGFQPYAMSNAELTVAIQALQAQLANQ